MTSETWALLFAVLAAAPGLYAVWRQSRRDIPDVAEVYQRMASSSGSEIESLRQRMTIAERKISRYQRILDAWRIGIDRLINQLCDANLKPVWEPEDEPDDPEPISGEIDIPTRPRKRKDVQDG